MRPHVLICLVLPAWLLVGCGSDTPIPGGPSPVPDGSAGPALTVTDVSVKAQTATFTWTSVPGATGYVLEIGRTYGATDVAEIVLDAAVTTHRVVEIPTGIAFARVRARTNATTGAAGSPVRFLVPDMRDVIEALFLGSGPYADTTSVRTTPVMLGWPDGTLLRTRTAGLINGQHDDLERSLDLVATTTRGAVTGAIVDRSLDVSNFFEAPPTPEELHVGVEPYLPLLTAPCESEWVEIRGGCTELIVSNGVIHAARAVASFNPLMHHVGHAALGLRHLQLSGTPTSALPGLPIPAMANHEEPSGSVLTPMELDAIEMVYAAGLRGGAPRSAFYAAGLIRNP